MNKNKGITLMALVITIIILIILAGITISAISEKSGILERTKNAKIEQEKNIAEEYLKVQLMKILTDNEGNVDLNKLDGMNIDGYDTKVSQLSKVVTMTKGKQVYYFLVDSNYNVKNLQSVTIESNKNEEEKENKKEEIGKVGVTITDVTGSSFVINVEPEDESKISVYEYYINDNKVYIGEEKRYQVSRIKSKY